MTNKYKNVIGMDIRDIKLVPYNPEWADIFTENKQYLQEILKGFDVQIHHIGSTSIPTVPFAKPIIDIIIFSPNLYEINNRIYENGLYEKDDYIKSDAPRVVDPRNINYTYNFLHLRSSNDSVDRLLRFKRYLIEHPDKAKQYAEIKAVASEYHKNSLSLYSYSKEEFIMEINKKAEELYTK